MGDSSQPSVSGSARVPGWRGDATIGRYRLVRKLAVGGMAELHLAVAGGFRGFSKLVVLKRVRGGLSHRADMRSMLLDEARLAARLQHRNLVDALELGEADDGEPYYVMRYVAGVDLRALLGALRRRGRTMSLDLAVHIVGEAAAGLHHAHRLRDHAGRPLHVVHRDVSTANIRVGVGGEVVVLDFGVARSQEQSLSTAVGNTKGNAAYMSPEQCRGAAIDRRTDVFALGIVLYELSTGRRLFAAGDAMSCMRKVLEGAIVPPSRVRLDMPPALEAIILRALSAERSQRFSSAQQLADALDRVVAEQRWSDGAPALARLVHELFETPQCPTGEIRERMVFDVTAIDHDVLETPTTVEPSEAASPWLGEDERTQRYGVG